MEYRTIQHLKTKSKNGKCLMKTSTAYSTIDFWQKRMIRWSQFRVLVDIRGSGLNGKIPHRCRYLVLRWRHSGPCLEGTPCKEKQITGGRFWEFRASTNFQYFLSLYVGLERTLSFLLDIMWIPLWNYKSKLILLSPS